MLSYELKDNDFEDILLQNAEISIRIIFFQKDLASKKRRNLLMDIARK
jgi:hypothetical protein